MSEIELVEKEEDNFDAFDAYFAPDSEPVQPTNENGEVIKSLHRSALAISILDIFFMISFIMFLSLILFCFLFLKTYYSLMSSIAALFSIVTYCLARNHSVEVTEAAINVFISFFMFHCILYLLFRQIKSFFRTVSINICDVESVTINPALCIGYTVSITHDGGKIAKIKAYQSETLYSVILNQMQVVKGEEECKTIEECKTLEDDAM